MTSNAAIHRSTAPNSAGEPSSTTRETVSAPNPKRRNRSRGWKGAAFTAPFFLGFLLLFVVPIVYAMVQSLYTEKSSGLGLSGTKVAKFVGLQNFQHGFTDAKFWESVLRVGIFSVIQIPITLSISLLMALLLDALRRRSAQRYRFAFMVPYMVPAIVGTLIWVYLYSPSVGPLTPMFRSLGIDVDFFSSAMVWVSIGNLITWTSAGFNMLIIFGALQSVPRETFDAARVDGASEWRIARSIKIPYVRSSLVLTGMLSIIGMLQLFNEPLLFRSVSPQTVTKDFTPILMIYNQAFDNSDYNYAAALSVILAMVVGLASFLFYWTTNRPQP